jgi:hypothetical protein
LFCLSGCLDSWAIEPNEPNKPKKPDEPEKRAGEAPLRS